MLAGIYLKNALGRERVMPYNVVVGPLTTTAPAFT